MKKFFKYLGFGVLSIVLFLIAIVVIIRSGSIDEEETFPPYIAASVPRLATWDIEQYKLLMSDEALEAVTQEQWRLLMKNFKTLGALQQVGTPEHQDSRVITRISSGTTTYAMYQVPLTFDTGEAHVQLGLQYNSGKIQIYSIHFLSDLLLK